MQLATGFSAWISRTFVWEMEAKSYFSIHAIPQGRVHATAANKSVGGQKPYQICRLSRSLFRSSAKLMDHAAEYVTVRQSPPVAPRLHTKGC
jgi:hypothetical protein